MNICFKSAINTTKNEQKKRNFCYFNVGKLLSSVVKIFGLMYSAAIEFIFFPRKNIKVSLIISLSSKRNSYKKIKMAERFFQEFFVNEFSLQPLLPFDRNKSISSQIEHTITFKSELITFDQPLASLHCQWIEHLGEQRDWTRAVAAVMLPQGTPS